MTTALATAATAPERSLVTKFAERFGVDPAKMLSTLKATAFKQSNDKEVSNEQMMALLIVADQYGLNPFTKEIFAFDDKHKGIVPVVSVDGWARIINEHRQLDGIEFRYAEKMTTMPDGKSCPEWCESVITRKDRSQPIVVREYLDEVYQAKRNGYTGPWQTHTKRMLRHKTLIQGSRVAFGFAGIHDEDEAYRIIDGQSTRVQAVADRGVTELQHSLQQRAQSAAIEHQPEPEPEAADGVNPRELRGRIFLADTVDELEAAAADIALLPEGDEKDEINELHLRRRADIDG